MTKLTSLFSSMVVAASLAAGGVTFSDAGAAPRLLESDRATTIQIMGRREITVTDEQIRLSDVADISAARAQDDEGVIALRKVALGTSPKPGEQKLIDAQSIVDRLRAEGVRLSEISYSFPRTITVNRAYREVPLSELEQALRVFLARGDGSMQLRRLEMEQPIRVPASARPVEAVSLRTTQPGHIGVDFRAMGNEDEMRFQMRALVDEWRLMPTARRVLPKGTAVSAADVELVRTNVAGSGRALIEELSDIIGGTVVRDIGQGENFLRGSVQIPPTIAAGAEVTLVYRNGTLEASASGTALSSASIGEEIRVRNDSSKKVVRGTVLDIGLVSVGGSERRN